MSAAFHNVCLFVSASWNCFQRSANREKCRKCINLKRGVKVCSQNQIVSVCSKFQCVNYENVVFWNFLCDCENCTILCQCVFSIFFQRVCVLCQRGRLFMHCDFWFQSVLDFILCFSIFKYYLYFQFFKVFQSVCKVTSSCASVYVFKNIKVTALSK